METTPEVLPLRSTSETRIELYCVPLYRSRRNILVKYVKCVLRDNNDRVFT